MKLEIGDNLVHLMQLAILSALCVTLAIFAHVDVTALLAGFFGVGGGLSILHLSNMASANRLSDQQNVQPEPDPQATQPRLIVPQNGPSTPVAG